MEQLTQFINTVGFPIVACIFMWKQQMELAKTIKDLQITLEGIKVQINQKEDK